MPRAILPLVVAITVLIGIVGAIPGRSVASQGTPPAGTPGTPVATFPQPAELYPDADCADWENADVRPPAEDAAVVTPAAERATPEPDLERALYMVVITLPPGECMPFKAVGNQKDGAIVLMVHEGIVDFTAKPYYDGPTPVITWGDTAGLVGDVPLNATQRFHPGDWITMDQRVWFTYRSVGGDPAVVLKAVWAAPVPPGSGSHGGNK